jgi:hypothetical protein
MKIIRTYKVARPIRGWGLAGHAGRPKAPKGLWSIIL